MPPEVLTEPETVRGRTNRALMPLDDEWSDIGLTISAVFNDAAVDPLSA